MIIKDVIKQVEDSEKYKEWKKGHDNYFLAHVFKMLDKENEKQWQIGYCNKDNDYISSFMVEGDNVEILEEQKPFKKPGTEIEELDLDKVKLDWTEALDKADELKKLKYPKELPIKSFFILQKIGKDNIYNITFFTQTFQALNIRVNPDDGSILKDSINKFFEMGH